MNIHAFLVFTRAFQSKSKGKIYAKPDRKSSIFGIQWTKIVLIS